MKSDGDVWTNYGYKSPLAIAEWIEISKHDLEKMEKVSPLAIAEWIEIAKL